jgi:predicted nucleic acid-binding protein
MGWVLPEIPPLPEMSYMSETDDLQFVDINWDAMIINSASQLGCKNLWSEDLQSGQRFGSIAVKNPFLG